MEAPSGRIDLVPAEGIGGAALAEVFPDGPGRVVIPGAEALSAALPPALSARGWQVEHVGVYRTTAVDEVPQELRARWRAGHYDALVATAASVARAAAALLGTTGLGATGLGGAGRVVALGDASAEAARVGFTDVVIARDATAEAPLEAVFESGRLIWLTHGGPIPILHPQMPLADGPEAYTETNTEFEIDSPTEG